MIIIGNSLLIIPLFILIGRIIDAIPKTSNKLATHEPIMLPREMSEFFCIAAPTEIANSGAEVPNPTKITEIIKADTPSLIAVFAVPSTSISDPLYKRSIPMINAGIASPIVIMLGV